MITKKELNDWMVENECDIFMDAPIETTDEQWDAFGQMFLNRVNEKFGINIEFDEDWYENIHLNTMSLDSDEDVIEIGLQAMADWINQNNIIFDFD